MRLRISIIGLLVAGLLSGCTSGGSGNAAPDPITSNGVTVSGPLNAAPVIEFGADAKPVKDLIAKDIVVGTGAVVTPLSNVEAHYIGYGMNTKAKFDSSWDHGGPIPFSINGVIQGWGQGLQGMKVGGRRLLIIPGDLGYGPAGNGSIEPNETLVFVVDLTAVS
jgi:peptidylprolyl isomerase